jgi:hypothetical protein
MRNTAVANNATQPSLWAEEQAPIYHQLIEVHYHGGREEIYCCENPYRPTGGIEIYAGYVGFPVPAGECTLCTKEART